MRLLRAALLEFRALTRTRDVLFWVVAWPVIWMFIVAYVFAPPGAGALSAAVVDSGGGENFAKAVAEALRAAGFARVDVMERGDVGELVDSYGAVVVIPPNALLALRQWRTVNITIYVKAENPGVAYMKAGAALQGLANLSNVLAMERINFTIRLFPEAAPWIYGLVFPLAPRVEYIRPQTLSDRGGMLGWYTLGTVGYVAVLTALSSSVGFFAYRRSSGVLKRLLAAPTGLGRLVAIDIIATAIMVAISSAVVIATGVTLGARISWPNALAPLGIAVAFLFSYGMGLALAPFMSTARGATAIATVMALTIVFTTGIWWPPKEALAEPLRAFADVFPPSVALDAVRDIAVWQKPWEEAALKIAASGLGAVAMITVSALILRRFGERYLY